MHFSKASAATFLFLFFAAALGAQPQFGGFVRAGLYTGFDKDKDRFYMSSAFSDIFLHADYSPGGNFRTYAEFRYRYGTEFRETVNSLSLREGYVSYSGKGWEISAGQKIIKWGRADFTNPSSKLTPRDLLLRSPDREEINLGNLLAEVNVFPSERIRIQGIVVPLYRQSVLAIEPVPLPSYVTIGLIEGFLTENAFTYGFRTDFYLRGIDLGFSWFHGYDPMPGLALSRFALNDMGGFPVPDIGLEAKPYTNRVGAIDFEGSSGAFGFRGEVAYSFPAGDFRSEEYVPLKAVDIVAGADWTKGKFIISVEYYGRLIPGFEESEVEPIIGTEPDIEELARLFSTPGANVSEYVRQQVAAFNRLYNYQLERFYHTASARIEASCLYDRLITSLFTMYNATSGDWLLMPEIRYKPADGLTLIAGAEYYRGPEGSLYNITGDFMNSIYFGIRANF